MEWTKEEEQIIKDNHGKITLPQMMLMFPHRKLTYTGFRSKVQRMGLFRDKTKVRLPVKNTYNYSYFKEPNLTNSYLAGAISTDGCLFIDKFGTTVFCYKVAIKDECIVNFIKDELNFLGKKCYCESVSPHYPDRITKFVYIRISCFEENAKYLKQYYNIVPNKTLKLQGTNLQDLHLNLAFLRGCLDGDGTISMRGTEKYDTMYITLCSSSQEILNWTKDLIDTYFPYNNGKNTISNIRTLSNNHKGSIAKNLCYTYTINGVRAAIVFDYLSQIPDIFCLERKWKNPKVLEYVNRIKTENPHLFIPYGSLQSIVNQSLTSNL